MKIVEPIAVRDRLAEVHGWETIDQIAKGLGMSIRTVSRTLRGEPARYSTIKTLAASIGTTANEIAITIPKD